MYRMLECSDDWLIGLKPVYRYVLLIFFRKSLPLICVSMCRLVEEPLRKWKSPLANDSVYQWRRFLSWPPAMKRRKRPLDSSRTRMFWIRGSARPFFPFLCLRGPRRAPIWKSTIPLRCWKRVLIFCSSGWRGWSWWAWSSRGNFPFRMYFFSRPFVLLIRDETVLVESCSRISSDWDPFLIDWLIDWLINCFSVFFDDFILCFHFEQGSLPPFNRPRRPRPKNEQISGQCHRSDRRDSGHCTGSSARAAIGWKFGRRWSWESKVSDSLSNFYGLGIIRRQYLKNDSVGFLLRMRIPFS